MKKYLNIIFLQGEDAEEVLEIIRDQGESAAMNYLKEWDMGDSCDESETHPAGRSDSSFIRGNYIMNYNDSLSYVGLCRVVESEAS